MAQNEFLKRYIDALLEFTTLTQGRAEALVKELVKAGELQADQARETVSDLLERSRRNSEKLLETIHQEVRAQITAMGLASRDDLDKLEARISGLFNSASGSAKRTAKTASSKKASATKATSKKASATKATAKKSAPRKTAAKKTASARSAATNSSPDNSSATKSAATKSTPAAAKKSTAKRTATKKAPTKRAPAKKAAAKKQA